MRKGLKVKRAVATAVAVVPSFGISGAAPHASENAGKLAHSWSASGENLRRSDATARGIGGCGLTGFMLNGGGELVAGLKVQQMDSVADHPDELPAGVVFSVQYGSDTKVGVTVPAQIENGDRYSENVKAAMGPLGVAALTEGLGKKYDESRITVSVMGSNDQIVHCGVGEIAKYDPVPAITAYPIKG